MVNPLKEIKFKVGRGSSQVKGFRHLAKISGLANDRQQYKDDCIVFEASGLVFIHAEKDGSR